MLPSQRRPWSLQRPTMGPRAHRFPRELTKLVPLRVGAGRRRDIAHHQRVRLRSPCIAATTPHVGCDQPAAPRRSQRTFYILTASDSSGDLFTGSPVHRREAAPTTTPCRGGGGHRLQRTVERQGWREPSNTWMCARRVAARERVRRRLCSSSTSRPRQSTHPPHAAPPRSPIAQRPDQGAAADTGCSGRSRARNGARRAAHGRASDAPTTFGRLLVNRARGRKRCPSVQLRAEFPNRLFERREAQEHVPW